MITEKRLLTQVFSQEKVKNVILFSDKYVNNRKLLWHL